jgi:FixJ family two-component response regulator
MNGMDFVEAARRETPSLPCILLTGHFALDAVPDDGSVMQKPFTTSSLHEAVTAALQTQVVSTHLN